ncbi:MAG: hypothetical protein KDB03_07150 [Planctomycetales bacterium]|nr:hypothetical protein [Planctomycetales bacterium]
MSYNAIPILFEHPWIAALVGLGITTLFAWLWLQKQHRSLAWLTLTCGLLTLSMVWASLAIETDREQIRSMLQQGSDAVQNNDHKFVINLVHPSATDALQRVKSELPRYHFEEARITRIASLEVNPDTQPKTAIVEMFARAKIELGGHRTNVVRFVKLYLMQQDEKWLIRDYEHFPPQDGLRQNHGEQ